jgi:hypothetical protein
MSCVSVPLRWCFSRSSSICHSGRRSVRWRRSSGATTPSAESPQPSRGGRDAVSRCNSADRLALFLGGFRPGIDVRVHLDHQRLVAQHRPQWRAEDATASRLTTRRADLDAVAANHRGTQAQVAETCLLCSVSRAARYCRCGRQRAQQPHPPMAPGRRQYLVADSRRYHRSSRADDGYRGYRAAADHRRDQ